MNQPTLSARRLIGAFVVACAVTWAPIAAITITGSGLASAGADPTKCATSKLVVWLTPQVGGGYAGGYAYTISFTNVGTHACTLFGFPGVSAHKLPTSLQLGKAAGQDGSLQPTTLIAPFATATAVLLIADAGNFPASTCGPTWSGGLRVYPPGSFTWKWIPYYFSACSLPGPTYLMVESVT